MKRLAEPNGELRQVLISLTWAMSCGYITVCDTWPMRRQTYGHLPSLRASPSFDQYQVILLGDRGTQV